MPNRDRGDDAKDGTTGDRSADEEILAVPQGSFRLSRLPQRDNLRAWDAADEYLLNHLSESHDQAGSLLIMNDAFGALACALAQHEPILWSDSFLSHGAASANLVANGLDSFHVTMLPSSRTPVLEGGIGTLLIKIPKTLALLEFQLHTIRPFLGPGTVIVGAGMSKHIHTSTLELFKRILGPTRTSLAKKKARLAFVTLDVEADPGPAIQPTSYEFGPGRAAVTFPGVFANRRLDIGTRFLLQHLPVPLDHQTVLDLGCGNGVVGTVLAISNPSAQLVFADSSYLAIASAQATMARAFHEGRVDRFLVGNSADELEDGSVDLVVINPPFHDQFVVGTETARQMFADAKRVLRSGGQLRVVGNRHLGHHVTINHLFGNVKTLASNKKFVVLVANKS